MAVVLFAIVNVASRAYGKVGRSWMMKHERRDAGLGIHHETIGELHADLTWVEQAPDGGLIVEPGAGRIPEGVALAAVLGLKALKHRHLGWIGVSPAFS